MAVQSGNQVFRNSSKLFANPNDSRTRNPSALARRLLLHQRMKLRSMRPVTLHRIPLLSGITASLVRARSVCKTHSSAGCRSSGGVHADGSDQWTISFLGSDITTAHKGLRPPGCLKSSTMPTASHLETSTIGALLFRSGPGLCLTVLR